MQIQTEHSLDRHGVYAFVEAVDYALHGKQVFERVLRMVAEKLAEQFIEEHGQEILAAIRPEAVATMTVAEAGAAVNETLHKKLPDKIERHVEREVYQRGVLGGLRRIA